MCVRASAQRWKREPLKRTHPTIFFMITLNKNRITCSRRLTQQPQRQPRHEAATPLKAFPPPSTSITDKIHRRERKNILSHFTFCKTSATLEPCGRTMRSSPNDFSCFSEHFSFLLRRTVTLEGDPDHDAPKASPERPNAKSRPPLVLNLVLHVTRCARRQKTKSEKYYSRNRTVR